METFEVVMIGNTAVGKTSMLSALSRKLTEYNHKLSGRVALEPTTHELTILEEQWTKMMEKVESQAPFTVLSDGIEGAQVDFAEHEFDFKVNGSREARVLFTDTRGKLTGNLDHRLLSRVNGAFGVFCVVDASVLMECPASKNARYNCPNFVERILNEVYTDGDDKQPRFIAFVLIKCEKYMSTKKGQRELSKAFHDKYDNIVNMLGKMTPAPNVYMLAIQTMCCVSFFKLNAAGWPEFRILPAKELKTKDCAYPLVILLRNLIETMDANVGFFGRILQYFGFKTDLREYLGELDANVDVPDLYEEL